MAYKDQLECPHCHMLIDIETEIEGDDGYMNLYPIVKPVKPKKRRGLMNSNWKEDWETRPGSR